MTHTTDESRCDAVDAQMAVIAEFVTDPACCTYVHPGRWSLNGTTTELETGYVHGQGTVRIYTGSSRTPTKVMQFLGRPNDLQQFWGRFQHPAHPPGEPAANH